MESKGRAPAIVVMVIGAYTNAWDEVLFGIEEEGIPFSIQQIHSAWQAARQSPLLVGIACDREKLIVHYKNLPASAPLFTLMYQQDNYARRSIGNNAARLVKGIPFREYHP